MSVLSRFADTTALESVLTRLTTRYLTLAPEARASALDRVFAHFADSKKDGFRIIVPTRADEPLRIETGNAPDPIAAFAEFEKAFADALTHQMLALPTISTPRSNAEANADRERLTTLGTLLETNPASMRVDGLVLDDENPHLSSAFVIFDDTLGQESVRVARGIARRENERQSVREDAASQHLQLGDVHDEVAIATSTLRAAARLNSLYRGDNGVDPSSLSGLTALWRNVLKNSVERRTGAPSAEELVTLANATEWRLARRFAGAARAEVGRDLERYSLRDRYNEFKRNIDQRRAELEAEENGLEPSDPRRAEIAGERAAFKDEAFQKDVAARRFLHRYDAFESVLDRVADSQSERQVFARRSRFFSKTSSDLHASAIEDAQNLALRLSKLEDRLDAAQIPAMRRYLLDAYVNEMRYHLDRNDPPDVLLADNSQARIDVDLPTLEFTRRPVAERLVATIVNDPNALSARDTMRDALQLHVSVKAIAALAEHPEELSRYTAGLRDKLQLLVAAYEHGNDGLLAALERYGETGVFKRAGTTPFFDNARLEALAPVQLLTRDELLSGESRIIKVPEPMSFTVSKARLVSELMADPDIAPLLQDGVTVQQLVARLEGPAQRRAQVIATDTPMARAIALTQGKLLLTVHPERNAQDFDAIASLPPAISERIGQLSQPFFSKELTRGAISPIEQSSGLPTMSDHQQRLGQAEGRVVALHTLVATPDGKRIRSERLTAESNIVRAVDNAPATGLPQLAVRNGLAEWRPIAGLIAVVERDGGQRTLVPIHAISGVNNSERFSVEPTRRLIEAMLVQEPVRFVADRERFGVKLEVQGLVRDRLDQYLDITLAQTPERERNAIGREPMPPIASRFSISSPALVAMRIEGMAQRPGYVRATAAADPKLEHQIPAHILPQQILESVVRGEPREQLMLVEPQLFTPSLRYKTLEPTVRDERELAYEQAVLVKTRSHHRVKGQIAFIPATSREPIPESADAQLLFRTNSYGYYAIRQPHGTTIVEYPPFGHATERFARFGSDRDGDSMDHEERDARMPLSAQKDRQTEPLALPSRGTFVSDGTRWQMLPADGAVEGGVLPAESIVVATLADLSSSRVAGRRGTKRGEVQKQDHDRVSVVMEDGSRRDTPRSLLARTEPDGREWEVLHDNGEHILCFDPVLSSTQLSSPITLVVPIPRSELCDEDALRPVNPGDRLTLERTIDQRLKIEISEAAVEVKRSIEIAR